MQDRYGSFSELARHEVEGVDYRVTLLDRPHSPVVVLAPHGGLIEIGTSELAARVAADEHSLFSFEGMKPRGRNRDLHVTSHRFDHPACVRLTERRSVALAIHGCIGESAIFLGGRDTRLVERLSAELMRAGFAPCTQGHRYPGRVASNICNRTARGCGGQLELTLDLRLAADQGLLSAAIRTALAAHIAELDGP